MKPPSISSNLNFQTVPPFFSVLVFSCSVRVFEACLIHFSRKVLKRLMNKVVQHLRDLVFCVIDENYQKAIRYNTYITFIYWYVIQGTKQKDRVKNNRNTLEIYSSFSLQTRKSRMGKFKIISYTSTTPNYSLKAASSDRQAAAQCLVQEFQKYFYHSLPFFIHTLV